MDPSRRAMIEGRRSRSPSKRDATSARFDPSRRVTKAPRTDRDNRSRQHDNGNSRGNDNRGSKANDSRYLTQDEQERRFVADEDKFVLRQSKKKADIRVREGRAKPIDYLAWNLGYIDAERDRALEDEDGDAAIDVPPPAEVVTSLRSTADLAQLEDDVASCHVLEGNARNRAYWTSLLSLCATQRAKLAPAGGSGGGDGERVVNSVADDIDRILAPKTYEQLETLEGQIKAKLRSDEDIDTDYWGQLLRSLAVWKAKATLAKVYDEIVQARQKRLDEAGITVTKPTSTSTSASSTSAAQQAAAPVEQEGDAGTRAQQQRREAPPPGTARFSQMDDGDGDDDGLQVGSGSSSAATDALYHREAARGVSENEEVFTAEEAVPGAPARPPWAEQYRPRKPRYFNRVQMGYEWNKYNQTHYDHSNPPPKVVQGYRFNIFYPELIDKTKAPTFKIIREHGRRRGESFAAAGETDTCLIRFIAGPPYEDIAFRIVDREWDYSAKRERGFKSSFDKGILQLHFQFKKIFYRK